MLWRSKVSFSTDPLPSIKPRSLLRHGLHRSKVWVSTEPLPSIKPRSLPSHGLYRAKVSFSTEPLTSIKFRSILSHGLYLAKISVSTELSPSIKPRSLLSPRSIPRHILVLYEVPIEHQDFVCRCVYAVFFSVSVFALWLHFVGLALVLCSGALLVCLCWAWLGFSAVDCTSTVRIGVLSLSHPAPQVSVSTEQKSWSLPSKAFVSISLKSRSLPSKSLVLYQALGLYRTQDSVSPEQDSAAGFLGINLCKQVNAEVSNCDKTDF
jgi:hypothetical protein